MAKSPEATNVQDALDDLEQRVETLENAKPTQSADTGKLDEFERRLSSVEQRDPHEEITNLSNRLDAMENRGRGVVVSPDDFSSLANRVAALEQNANNPGTGARPSADVDAAHVNYVMHKFFANDRPTPEAAAVNTVPSLPETGDPADAKATAPAAAPRVDEATTQNQPGANNGNTSG